MSMMRLLFPAAAAAFFASPIVVCGVCSVACGGGSASPAETPRGQDGGSTANDDAGRHALTDASIGDATAGDETQGVTDADAQDAPARTLGDFLGVNGFIDDPTDFLAAIGNVREYHDWQWCEGNGDPSYPGYPNNQNSFSLFGGSWDFDKYYGDLKAKGVFGYPVIQQGVPWLAGGAVPPVAKDASPSDPASYAAHADEMFQYAARYGSTKVADGLLKLAAGQTRLSGLGLLTYIEDFNEEDAWWVLSNGDPVFSPDVYAAMASADCDGDHGRMGKTLGMKNADPRIQCVMGGLSGKGTPNTVWERSIEHYLDGVRAWAAAHRGGDFPADVVNVHYYSFGPDSAGTTKPRPAVSPEDDHVKDAMARLAAYRDTNLRGKELWLTEFGYDTDPQSVLHAPALGSNSAEIVQGQWLVRYYLAVLAAGFDRAFLYVSRDGCAEGDASCATQFDTSGVATITNVKGQLNPKPAYYFVATLRNRLASFAWQGETTSASPNVVTEAFKNATHAGSSGSQGAYVVWSPTSNASIVHGFNLPIGSAATHAIAVSLEDQSLTGAESTLVPTGGNVVLDVSETPTIVLVDSN
jgi:hypothetical protein